MEQTALCALWIVALKVKLDFFHVRFAANLLYSDARSICIIKPGFQRRLIRMGKCMCVVTSHCHPQHEWFSNLHYMLLLLLVRKIKEKHGKMIIPSMSYVSSVTTTGTKC